jgi:hypothetical protein
MKIYVASSWRNDYQPEVVSALRADGHAVYDFKDSEGFHWEEVDPAWRQWPNDIPKYLVGLNHAAAERGFNRDMTALRDADICVYVMPCGVSASWEAGWAKGVGKPVLVYIPGLREPDLMVKLADLVTVELSDIVAAIRNRERCLRIANDGSERCSVERMRHGPETWIGQKHDFDGPRERQERYGPDREAKP